MTGDYTPGHALDDITRLITEVRLDSKVTPVSEIRDCLTRLYKAGQANERAAIVALLRSAFSTNSDGWEIAGLIERGDL